MDKKCQVLTMLTDVTDTNICLQSIISSAKSGTASYVCVSNVHMCMETFDDNSFRNVVNSADMVIADGKPISWMQKLKGFSDAKQVRGQDIMNSICDASRRESLKIGLYGGSSDEVLATVVRNLEMAYPGIAIEFAYSPPFRALSEEEDSLIVKKIRESKINVLFVGIGCPKQEVWMYEHKHSLSCAMLGVGAAFDFIAGNKSHAPKWMQNIGMEWFFRLASEPKRLWKRYLKQNPRFIWHVICHLIFKKKYL